MEEAVDLEDYERAAFYKTRVSQLTAKLDDTKAQLEKSTPIKLKNEDIARAVAIMTGIPVDRLKQSEVKLLRNLERHLSKILIGQDEAIVKVAQAIRRSRSGVANGNRPIGSFVFMGPTGVGKTELAKVLAREVFGSESSLIKIDMSEFSEKHNTSRLLGAPAGFVGYEDGGQLTDKIRRQPYSVVLFDEIEKAHPEVFQILLQLLEDGKITDAKGRQVDFSNTIIILTSNLGAERMSKEASLGFHATSKADDRKLDEMHKLNASAAEEALAKLMRPELVNRFDAIITFRALTIKQVSKIFDRLIEELQDRLAKKGIGILITSSAKNYLIKQGYSEKYGVRPLRRVLQNELEHTIAEGILGDSYQKGDILEISLKENKIFITIKNELSLV